MRLPVVENLDAGYISKKEASEVPSLKQFLCNAYLFDQTHANEALVCPLTGLGLCACYEITK